MARARREVPRLTATEIYFLTDFGRASWDLSSVAGGRQIRDKLASLAESTRIAVVDLGQEHCENLAIVGLHSNQQVYTMNGPVVFQADIRNFGSQAHHVQVDLLVDGQRFQERTLDIAPAPSRRLLSRIASRRPETMRSKRGFPAIRSTDSISTTIAGSPFRSNSRWKP